MGKNEMKLYFTLYYNIFMLSRHHRHRMRIPEAERHKRIGCCAAKVYNHLACQYYCVSFRAIPILNTENYVIVGSRIAVTTHHHFYVHFYV